MEDVAAHRRIGRRQFLCKGVVAGLAIALSNFVALPSLAASTTKRRLCAPEEEMPHISSDAIVEVIDFPEEAMALHRKLAGLSAGDGA